MLKQKIKKRDRIRKVRENWNPFCKIASLDGEIQGGIRKKYRETSGKTLRPHMLGEGVMTSLFELTWQGEGHIACRDLQCPDVKPLNKRRNSSSF